MFHPASSAPWKYNDQKYLTKKVNWYPGIWLNHIQILSLKRSCEILHIIWMNQMSGKLGGAIFTYARVFIFGLCSGSSPVLPFVSRLFEEPLDSFDTQCLIGFLDKKKKEACILCLRQCLLLFSSCWEVTHLTKQSKAKTLILCLEEVTSVS